MRRSLTAKSRIIIGSGLIAITTFVGWQIILAYPYLLENPSWVFETPSEKEIIESLPSHKNVDYLPLKSLLQNKQWEEADQETKKTLAELLSSNGVALSFMKTKVIKKIPCTDLLTIDRLWMEFSDGYFGYSVQTEIVERDNQLLSPEAMKRSCLKTCTQDVFKTIEDSRCEIDCETQRIKAEFERIPEEMGRGKSQVNDPLPMGYYPSPIDVLSGQPADVYRVLAKRVTQCRI